MGGSQVGSGGGSAMHPGAPIIWPTLKSQSTPQVTQTQNTEQAGSAASGVAAQNAAASKTALSPAQQASQQANTTSSSGQGLVMRSLSAADISTQLMSLGFSNSPSNVGLATKMLEHGMELSHENFQTLNQALEGKNASATTLEAALMALSKGVASNPAAVNSLVDFMSSNKNISQLMTQLEQNSSNLSSFLANVKGMLNPGLMSALSSVLSTYQKEIDKNKSKNSINNMVFNRSSMLNDSIALKSLLAGIQQMLAKEPPGKDAAQLQNLMQQLQSSLDEMTNHLTAQSIISQGNTRTDSALSEKYAYWQIPNFFLNPQKSIEIMMRKEKIGKNEYFDPERTRLIIKLESEKLGEITIIIDVKEKEIHYEFNTENEDARQFIAANSVILRETMDKLDWKVKGFNTVLRKVELQKYILPKIDLDQLRRVRAEA